MTHKKRHIKGFDQESALKGVSTLRKSLIESQKQALLAADQLEDAAFFGDTATQSEKQLSSISDSSAYVGEAAQKIQEAIQSTRAAKEALSYRMEVGIAEASEIASVATMQKYALRARRMRARQKRDTTALSANASTKTFNMRWINDTIESVIAELGEYSASEPELDAAVQALVASKRLISAYSQRIVDAPYRSAKAALTPATVGMGILNAFNVLFNRFISSYDDFARKNDLEKLINTFDKKDIPPEILDDVDEAIESFQDASSALIDARKEIETWADTLADMSADTV